jgi:hypothetical protein
MKKRMREYMPMCIALECQLQGAEVSGSQLVIAESPRPRTIIVRW